MIRPSTIAAAILSITFALTAAGEVPAEARALAEAREKELHRINLAYLQRLDALLARYRKSGDEKAAAAVAGMIREVERPDEPKAAGEAPGVAALVGKWRRDYDGSIFEFKDSKSGIFGGDMPFTVAYDAGSKRITLTSAKWVDSLAFTLNSDVLRGEDTKGTRYKLERVK